MKEEKRSIGFFKKLARPSVFFTLIAGFTIWQVYLLRSAVITEADSPLIILWFAAFIFLAFNLSVLAVQGLFALFLPPPDFPEVERKIVQSIPAALLYCIRNESFGLQERIGYTLQNNDVPNLDLWILSDSDEKHGREEERLVLELRGKFGKERVLYRRRESPFEKKQGNIKDWLVRFSAPYKYFIICDADSLLPKNWAEKTLCMAEHPANARIAVFQSATYITHESSLYSRMQAVGQFYAQRFYFLVNQAVLGRAISFGHNQLVRKEAFEKIELPAGILSHDTWETALLDRAGYRVVFVPGLVSYEEAPAHYLEERKRAKRWLKGTLQGWPLLFLPRISLSTRFLIFYQIYLYLVPPVLFFWIISGLMAAVPFQEKLFSAENTRGLLFWTFGLIFLHKFAVARSVADAGRILKEVLFTTLIGLQNVFYGTLDWLTLPLERAGWIPMSKKPGEKPAFLECVQDLFPGAAAGMILLAAGIRFSPLWTLYALPVILSLILSIPVVYLSSKTLSTKGANVYAG